MENGQQLTILDNARRFEISDGRDYSKARSLLKQMGDLKKEIKASYAKQKDLAHKAHRAVISAEKEYLEPVERAKGLIKQKMVEWADSNIMEEGIETRDHWSYEVYDFESVPRIFLQIDSGKVLGVVKSLKDQINIPGIRVTRRSIIMA